MIYAVLIYGSEARVEAWTSEEEQEVMDRHAQLRRDLAANRQLGPVMRLAPEGSKVIRKYKDRRYITDGPFAETKEQLMGIYVIECATFDEAVIAAEHLAFETWVFEIRPITWLDPGLLPARMPDSDR